MSTAVRTGNYLGATSIGSFATVGDSTAPSPDCAPRAYLALEIGEACQLKCRHCIYHRQQPHNPMPNDRIISGVLDSLRGGLNPTWIILAGKEPTLFPDELVRAARTAHSPQRFNILMTNGLLLKDTLLEQLSDVIDLFDISLDGTARAHDWMRGTGTFQTTWERITYINKRYDKRIGILATAVHADTCTGRPQYLDLLELANDIACSFAPDGRIVLAVTPYFGPPDDPMRLTPEDLVQLIAGLAATKTPAKFQFTASYFHLLALVLRELGIDLATLEYDTITGLPVLKFGSVTIILFNLTPVPQISLRVSNDGLVFLGCNHLVLGDDARSCAVADLADESFDTVVSSILGGTHSFYDHCDTYPDACVACSDFGACRGGDRVAGMYFSGRAADPYCCRIRQG